MSDEGRLDRLFMQIGGINAKLQQLEDAVHLLSQRGALAKDAEAKLERIDDLVREEWDRIEGRLSALEKRTSPVEAASKMAQQAGTLATLMDRVQEVERRLLQLEDCYTSPDNGVEAPAGKDPKMLLWDRIYEGVKQHHTRKLGDVQQQQFATRLTNALWKAGFKSPEKIAAATDKRLAGLNGVGYRYGIAVLRATFPRAL